MKGAEGSDPAIHAHEGPHSFRDELEDLGLDDETCEQVLALHERYMKRDVLYHASFAMMQIVDRVRDLGYLPALLCYELGIVTAQNPAEIAERFGVSKQAVHQVRERLRAKLPLERWVMGTQDAESFAPVRPGRGFVDIREASKMSRMPLRVLKQLKADGIIVPVAGLDGTSHWFARAEIRKLARRWAISQASAQWPMADVKPVKDVNVKQAGGPGPSFLQSQE